MTEKYIHLIKKRIMKTEKLTENINMGTIFKYYGYTYININLWVQIQRTKKIVPLHTLGKHFTNHICTPEKKIVSVENESVENDQVIFFFGSEKFRGGLVTLTNRAYLQPRAGMTYV